VTPVLRRAAAWWGAERSAYAGKAGDERPIGGYAGAMGVFALLSAGVAGVQASRRQRPLSALDLVLVGMATHKLARTISRDAVTSPLRAPFTTYVEPGGPGEVVEEVRGEGARHAVGELLTCPFCLSPWVAAALVGGLAVAPGVTRTVTTVFSAVTVADALQFGYAALERAAE
jgi:hypothetical protein